MNITVSDLSFTPAGEERLKEAARRGEQAFGALPLHEISVEEDGKTRVYLIGPISEGGRDDRLAWYDIGI